MATIKWFFTAFIVLFGGYYACIGVASCCRHMNEDEERRVADYMQRCQASGINEFECTHMLKVEDETARAADNAAWAAGASTFGAINKSSK